LRCFTSLSFSLLLKIVFKVWDYEETERKEVRDLIGFHDGLGRKRICAGLFIVKVMMVFAAYN